MNRAERRSWAAMVREARATSTEVSLNDEGETFTVFIPDADKLAEVFQSQGVGDIYGALAKLFGNGDDAEGERRVARLREEAKRAAGEDGRVPISAWRTLLEDTFERLGLRGDPGR